MVTEEGENLRFVLSTVTTTSSDVETSERDPGSVAPSRETTTNRIDLIKSIRLNLVYTFCGFLHEITSIFGRL